MARGFESKDVEFQQAEASRKREPRRAMTPLSEGEREALVRRQTLELSLARARSELASARSQAHRRMLERAIASLEAQVEAER
jgi:putative hemolysin